MLIIATEMVQMYCNVCIVIGLVLIELVHVTV